MDSSNSSFSDLIARLRQGDALAATELVRDYEAELRIVVKARLRDPRLRRTLETMDICQSVLANFFVRASAGQFDLDSPEQLKKLLARMVRNKVTDQARRQTAQRRDVGRHAHEGIDEYPVAARQDSPSQIVAAEELVQKFRELLPEEDRRALDLRREGQSWASIAAQHGGTAEAIRKRVSRAVDLVAARLGLE